MKFTILIPHWKTGKMTAYAIAQHLKLKGDHEIDIVVIDNNAGDGSTKYLDPFLEHITIVDYPKDKLQSHGIAFDYVLPHIKTGHFIATESDSFPTIDNWLEYYKSAIEKGYEMAGSRMQLSGGEYIHPCGALYKISNWWQAKNYCDNLEYSYYPNMAMKEGFACHLMVHKKIEKQFLESHEDWIVLADGYLPYHPILAESKKIGYSPTVGPFHNGMGRRDESVKTYGFRNIESDSPFIYLIDKPQLIKRIGYEPGQWFSYWHYASKKNVLEIPTTVRWINDKPGTQQEFTIMANGFKHLWGISAWKEADPNNEYAKIKQPIPGQLYDSLPEHQKISE